MNETKKNIGIIGWRGLVGQTLCQRMVANRDFAHHNVILFSSQQGLNKPHFADHHGTLTLKHLADTISLATCDILLVCQGSDYTQDMLPQLRAMGWQGYWIDASSHLRHQASAQIILDPINGDMIQNAIRHGQRDFVGANCCTSLLLLALQGLYAKDLIAHVDTTTYQALSGAGAQTLTHYLNELYAVEACDAETPLYEQCQLLDQAPNKHPILNQVLPTIDLLQPSGWTKEELKFSHEATLIRGKSTSIDATCLRVNMLRCHLQSLVVTLTEPLTLSVIKGYLSQAHPWIKLIDDTAIDSGAFLAKSFTNTLDIGLARLRINPERPYHLHLLTMGDQLLWGAAEPLRRLVVQLL